MALRFVLTTLLALLGTSFASADQAVRDRHVSAQLVALQAGIVPGEPVTVGLLLRHDPHWHTYWKTTATGYASSLDWNLPEGFQAGEIQWTVPRVYDFSGFIEYVYEDEELLPVELIAPAHLQVGETITLRATAAWLMCEKTCIPGEVELSLTLPVLAEQGRPNPPWAGHFEAAFEKLPVSAKDFRLSAWRKGTDTAVLQIEGDPEALAGELYFFDEQTFILPEAKQTQEQIEPGVVRMQFPIDVAGVSTVEQFQGVLRTTASWVAGEHRPALKVNVPFAEEPPEGAATAKPAATETKPVGMAAILAGAFLGGLILNLMPCVFPVLGIKIMGFVNQAGSNRRKVILHGLVFTGGVLLSFWILAGALIFLRAGGAQLGWGFQLQNPVFVYVLAVFLLLFALNMSGVFEVGQSAVGTGSDLTGRKGLSGSFFSGVLATVVATPCAAPFLGPALGIALALPALSSLVVFTAIALGLASPYLLLSVFPHWVRMLPRPGPWMESFKQFMAFLLYGTVGYLLWVLVGQLTEPAGFTTIALLRTIFALIATALAAWIYGRWGVLPLSTAIRRRAMIGAIAVLAAGFAFGYPHPAYDPDALAGNGSPMVQWETWEPGKPEALAARGRLVYVDFTARWCVTCQSNKAVVFSSSDVRSFFHENKVVALKADWTTQDPTIADELRRFGRSAVPFNLVYGPGTTVPRPLPELLTPSIVLEALHTAKGNAP